MNKNYILWSLCLFVIVLISSCSPPEPNFDLNNVDLMSSEVEPVDYTDSILVKRVFANDIIYLEDISGELEKITKRYWDTNDDGEWDKEFQDQDFIEIAFQDEGFHKIVFCVNEKDNCVTKWVYVLTSELPVTTDPQFIVFENYIETPDRSYNLEVETENIFAKEELGLTVNGEAIDFEFNPEDNKLSAKIRGLKKGEETSVEIQAHTTDGDIVENITIKRADGNDPPPPLGPSVKIIGGGKTVADKNIRIKAVTKNYDGDALDITLNNKKITEYRTSGSKGNWVISLALQEGRNKLVVSLPDKSKSAQTNITYDKPKPKPPGPTPDPGDLPVAIQFADYSPGQKVNINRSPIEVKVTTENVSKKNLVFKLGSKKLTENNYKRVRHYGPLKANSDWVVTLDLERNKSNIFSVEGKDVIQRVTFIYEDEKPASGVAGLKAPASVPSCLKNIRKEEVTITLKTAKSLVALEEFSIYTSSCGRVAVSLNGPGYSDTFYASVIDVGKSQIIFEDLPELEVNSTYQLTIKPSTGGGCASSVPPLLKSAENCSDLSSHSSTALTISEPDGKFIFDLKY